MQLTSKKSYLDFYFFVISGKGMHISLHEYLLPIHDCPRLMLTPN